LTRAESTPSFGAFRAETISRFDAAIQGGAALRLQCPHHLWGEARAAACGALLAHGAHRRPRSYKIIMSNSVNIIACNTPDQRKQFIEFQWQIYKDDPYWVPPLISERKAFYDKTKNPFFEHSDAQMFMAVRDSKTVGTIVAIENRRHNEFHEEKTGFFGGFECINDAGVAKALFDAAKDWVKARGLNILRGPTTISLNDECGLLIEGFDSIPMVLMPYNPRYYIELIEGYGFSKAMDLWAWWTSTDDAMQNAMKKLQRVVNIAEKRGKFTVRNIDFKRLDEEVAALMHIYTGEAGAWKANWGHVPMTHHEVEHTVKNLRQFADPEFIFVAEQNGVPIALSLTLPNVNPALHKAYPSPKTPELLTLAKFLWYRRSMVNSVRFVLLGVLPEHRMSGIDGMLIYRTLELIHKKGYIGGEMSWILETNDAMNRIIQLPGATLYKKYRIYDFAIG
jgi:GNAT superfamily N-acetyltransferase